MAHENDEELRGLPARVRFETHARGLILRAADLRLFWWVHAIRWRLDPLRRHRGAMVDAEVDRVRGRITIDEALARIDAAARFSVRPSREALLRAEVERARMRVLEFDERASNDDILEHFFRIAPTPSLPPEEASSVAEHAAMCLGNDADVSKRARVVAHGLRLMAAGLRPSMMRHALRFLADRLDGKPMHSPRKGRAIEER